MPARDGRRYPKLVACEITLSGISLLLFVTCYVDTTPRQEPRQTVTMHAVEQTPVDCEMSSSTFTTVVHNESDERI